VRLVDPVRLEDTTESNVELGHSTQYELIRADTQGAKVFERSNLDSRRATLHPPLRRRLRRLIADASVGAQPVSAALLSGRSSGSSPDDVLVDGEIKLLRGDFRG
jgi:hypothetical protein